MWGEDRERPYRVESWVVGARACLPSARSARSKVGVETGERARGLGDQEGHRVTAALGVGIVVVACLTDPAGACDAAPRAISLRAPLWFYTEVCPGSPALPRCHFLPGYINRRASKQISKCLLAYRRGQASKWGAGRKQTLGHTRLCDITGGGM